MRFTVGDAEHYTTVGANAAFLPLLAHVLPFTIMLGSTLGFFFLLCTCSDSYCPLQSAYYTVCGDTALLQLLIVQWRSARLMRYLWGQTAFLFDCGRTHFFTAGGGTSLPILVRLKLPLPVNTAVVLQQSALL